MLAFIIPLKSARMSGSWELVCALFKRTLLSVCNQNSLEYHVIVVCHEKPEIDFYSPKVTYIQVDLPLPSSDYDSKEKDKMLKMQAGLLHAKSINASHVMFVDADDCVSNKIAEFVDKNSKYDGWFIGKGFDFQEDIQRLRLRNKNLHLRTNSSHIIKLNWLEREFYLLSDEIKRGNCSLYHIDTVSILEKRGAKLSLLPFRGVIYITDNGENMWWKQDSIAYSKSRIRGGAITYLKKFYRFLITQPITETVKREFGLYTISR
ncbi:hypothetical protein VB780_12250 [Leptolyngbya sp. CCNP1308]|uniref:hypothetical protein n=1 Tax=Leptolyngbya sp. CCNP1308 TaxID=3110255 RepID=UPI002B205FFB|nr:hypothetical protein [Leptolyngbya sp. CCNP1308]MEA5449345.1 hypothetical protein [Leptolyngbya sp. CCNP1308]